MSNDNPYAPADHGQMSGTVSFGGAAPSRAAQPSGLVGEADATADLIKDTTTADFVRDVIEASRRQPVLVDFWAPWCGPCKQLTPMIEKAVRDARGRVRLVKLNIDDHPAIPGQMGVQSIPAVVAFVNGKPVDGFMGAVPESQLRQFIDRLAGPADAGETADAERIALVLEQSRAAQAEGDLERAAQGFAAILDADPSHAAAAGGLASCMISAGALDAAAELLEGLDDAARKATETSAAIKQLELARDVAALGDPAEFEARISADPNDHEARISLSKICNARGDRDGAAEQLFAIMRKQRGWSDDKARRTLLEFFEAWGAMDPATLAARRQLSSMLFS
ncbi:thioredoxin [Hoeflea marina]|uniref:Thioredoxin n=2 Tax=Hoeflea marina TaxID=274592 RepID=A0A317PQD1_9HYPH|nr:thioredoxin [Hoeflea marina]